VAKLSEWLPGQSGDGKNVRKGKGPGREFLTWEKKGRGRAGLETRTGKDSGGRTQSETVENGSYLQQGKRDEKATRLTEGIAAAFFPGQPQGTWVEGTRAEPLV